MLLERCPIFSFKVEIVGLYQHITSRFLGYSENFPYKFHSTKNSNNYFPLQATLLLATHFSASVSYQKTTIYTKVAVSVGSSWNLHRTPPLLLLMTKRHLTDKSTQWILKFTCLVQFGQVHMFVLFLSAV